VDELFAISDNINDFSYVLKKMKETPQEEAERLEKIVKQWKNDELR